MRTDMPGNILLIGFATLLASLVLLGISQLIFSRLENRIPERL
jgi:ABC-2 type transport system permease protein